MSSKYKLLIIFVCFASTMAHGFEVISTKVETDLSKLLFSETIWQGAHVETISLMGQPMAIPRPATTSTETIAVQSVNDGAWIAFRLRWTDPEKSEAGILGKFSDAVAIQFPVKDGPPPPIFMGEKDNPVHLFHWRAQYQRDVEQGKPEMRQLYPNMNVDMYPMEFKDQGKIKGLSEAHRDVYAHGKAAGNPQSFQKTSAVDELFAEGFGTSSAIENGKAIGHGDWKNGEWVVVISRPLKRENGSILQVGKDANMAFAVWQGGKDEVGSRKSLTMAWVPLKILGKENLDAKK